MDWLAWVKTMFSFGNNVTGYVNLVITPEQYKEITGKDYVASATVAQLIYTQSPKKSTIHKKPHQCDGAFIMGGFY